MTKLFMWFEKLFSSFGDDGGIATHNQCVDVVERARSGDQNAIALITLVRKNALKGNALAKQSLSEIVTYAKKSRPKVDIGADSLALCQACSMGQDIDDIGAKLSKVSSSSPHAAAVSVANSCDAQKLAMAIDSQIQNQVFRKSFSAPSFTLEQLNKLPHESQHAFLLGFVLGLATRIQMVRRPNVPLAVLSTNVAWELGQ